MLQLSLNVCGCMLVCGMGLGVRLGGGCPCPPVRNDIVTLRHLLIGFREAVCNSYYIGQYLRSQKLTHPSIIKDKIRLK